MKVSIIIPVYNVEQYIEDCINSVITQSEQDSIECILVDDCGIDNSMSIAEAAIEKYRRGGGKISFVIHHHKRNRGLSSARNTGINAARGEYILFVDSDDKLYRDSVCNLLRIAEQYPMADIIQGSTLPCFTISKEDFPVFSNNIEWIRTSFCTFSISDAPWNKLVKKDFIIKNRLFFVDGFIQEDTLWSYQISKCIHSIAFSFEPTYWYRYNPNGIMHGMGNEKEAKSFARVFNYVYNDLVNCETIEPYEIKYLIGVAKKTYHYVGRKKGRDLLVTKHNDLFNMTVRLSSNLSRFYSSVSVINQIRKFALWMIRYFFINPGILKLCKREYLLKNFTMVDFSQP